MEKIKVKVEKIGMLIDEKRETAECIVKISNKEYKAYLRYDYESNKGYKVSVTVDKLTPEILNTLNVELDTYLLATEFETKILEIRAKKEKAEKEKNSKFYDDCPLHKIKKELEKRGYTDLKIEPTREEYIQHPHEISLSGKGRIKIQYTKVYIGDTWNRHFKGYRFDIEKDYTTVKKITKAENVADKFEEVVKEECAEKERNRQEKESSDELKVKLGKVLNVAVEDGVRGRYNHKGHYETKKCYSTGNTKFDYDGEKVAIYEFPEITVGQFKKILDILSTKKEM